RRHRQLIVGARLALPERAAAPRLRSYMLPAKPRAPHGDVDALAEIAAGEAAARVFGGRVECHGCPDQLLLREHQHSCVEDGDLLLILLKPYTRHTVLRANTHAAVLANRFD